MEDDDGGGGAARFGKKKAGPAGEVDYQTKAGTAWSHNFLNQKPWHPLSYPNQRRKWIAEQTHAESERRAEEVSREFAQEQEFFRQTSLFSKKEKEKVEMMKAVSFMYLRPPGYNAESAKAAEIADEKKRLDQSNDPHDLVNPGAQLMPESVAVKNHPIADKKSRPKDVFGRTLPTEEEFEVLKNAPRLETGVPVRIKPFAVEVRNVRCVRCGTFGHQSGDRECPLKDVIMPNEESRLKRDDPLTAIMAHTDSSEPLKWELKHKPGMSPPRGGFRSDDPNQQIVGEEIFDEYGGFLGEGNVTSLLASFSGKTRKHSKHRKNKKSHSHEKLQPEITVKESKAGHKRRSSASESEDNDRSSRRKYREKHSHRPSVSRKETRQCHDQCPSRSDSESDVKLQLKIAVRESEAGHGRHSSTSESEDNDRSFRRKHCEKRDRMIAVSGRENRQRHYKRPLSSNSEIDEKLWPETDVRESEVGHRRRSSASKSEDNERSSRRKNLEKHKHWPSVPERETRRRHEKRFRRSDSEHDDEPRRWRGERVGKKSRHLGSSSSTDGSDFDRQLQKKHHRHLR